MTEQDGFRMDAAVQCGFTPTDPDAERYECTEAQLIAFSKACERAGMYQAHGMGSRDLVAKRIAEIDAELEPILAAEEERFMTAQGYVRGTDEPGRRWVKHDCDLRGGDCAAANPPVTNCPRDARKECERRGIDPDEICADGGVTAEMVVAKESPCAGYADDGSPCECARKMGNDFFFLPKGSCLK